MKEMDRWKALLISRRFRAAAVALVAITAHDMLGMDEQEITLVAGIVMAWILGDSWRVTESSPPAKTLHRF